MVANKALIALLIAMAGAAQARGHRLLWTPGTGLEALGTGQDALGKWQTGAGLVTGDPNLVKVGVANQVGSGFTKGAGEWIHGVSGRRSLQEKQQQQAVSDEEYSEQLHQAGEDLKTVGKTASEKAKGFADQLGDDFKQVGGTIKDGFNEFKDTLSNAFNDDSDSSGRRSLLWGEGLEALGAGQNALGQLQEGAGFWTGNPGLWKDGINNQIGAGLTEGAGQFIHAVAGGK